MRRATGRDAAEGTEGEVIASGTTGRVVAGEAGVRIFAGLAPDLFAANKTGIDAFRAALAALSQAVRRERSAGFGWS